MIPRRLLPLLLLLAGSLAPARPARARVPEAGAVSVAVALGPEAVFAPLLGGARALFGMALQGEYAIDPALGALVDVGVGLAGTVPLRVHAGARYRLGGLRLPLSPYAQLQLGYGRLFDVLGADLNYLSARLGIGADYFVTARWAAGITVASDIGGTLGARSALWGTVDFLLHAAMTL